MNARPDLRRRVAFRALGAARLLLDAHADLEDVEGALAADQLEVAAYAARQAIIRSLTIRGLETCGELDPASDQLGFDYFAGVPDGELTESLELAGRALDLDGEDDAARWLEAVRAHLRETERRLDYPEPLLSVRTPNGLFPALRLARGWVPILDELDLPQLLPKEWLGAS
jgi:hypothetical protein